MDERVSMLDEYSLDYQNKKSDLDQSIEYLSILNESLRDVYTVEQVKLRIQQFIDTYDVPNEVIDVLNSVMRELNSDSSVYDSCQYVTDMLQKMIGERELEEKNSKGKLDDIRKNVADHFEDSLNDVGVKISGDFEDFSDKIETKDDVDRLKDNIDRTVEYLKERQKIIGENETDVTLSTDQVMDATENTSSETILNAVLDEETTSDVMKESSNLEVDSTGAIVVSASSMKPESMDYMKMMVIGLMTPMMDPALANATFGMKMVKGQYNKEDFQVKFGNFSKSGESLTNDPKIMGKVQELSTSFHANVDYDSMLSQASPELSEAVSLFENHILGKEGMAQMAVKNTSGNYNFAFGLGEEFQNVTDSLNTNGAMTSQTPVGSSVSNIYDTTPGDTLMTLSSTNETLDQEKEMENNELSNTNHYVKVKSMDDLGNANFYILVSIAVFEIVSILLTIYFLR